MALGVGTGGRAGAAAGIDQIKEKKKKRSYDINRKIKDII